MSTLFSTLIAAVLLAAPGFTHTPPDEKKGGEGWLGVAVQDMTPRLARTMDLTTREGALVSDVVDDSPAAKADLKDSDIIVEFAGKAVTDADQLTEAVRATAPGSTVPIIVMRKNQRTSLSATLERRKAARIVLPRALKSPKIAIARTTRAPLGLQLRTLNEQLGRYFKAPEGRGVLVEEVREKSEAAKAGFRAGDVIVRAGTREVEEVYDVRRALRRASDGEKLTFEVIRNGSKTTLTVTVPESIGSSGDEGSWFGHGPGGLLHGEFEPGDLREFEFEFEIPDIEPEMDELRLKLEDMKGRLKRELKEGTNGTRRIIRRIEPRSVSTDV